MPHRRRPVRTRNVRSRKLRGLTPTEAHARAQKAWRTKHARYHYGKGHRRFFAEDDSHVGRDPDAPGAKDFDVEGFSRYLGAYGRSIGDRELVRMAEEDTGQLQDIFQQKVVRRLYRQAQRVNPEEANKFLANVIARQLAEQRQAHPDVDPYIKGGKSTDTRIRTGVLGGAFGSGKADRGLQGLLTMTPKRGQDPGDHYEFIHGRLESLMGPNAKPHEVNELAKAITEHHILHAGQGRARENASRQAVLRLTSRVANVIQNREEEHSVRGQADRIIAGSTEHELRDLQGQWKWGHFNVLSNRYLDPERPTSAEDVESDIKVMLKRPFDPHSARGGTEGSTSAARERRQQLKTLQYIEPRTAIPTRVYEEGKAKTKMLPVPEVSDKEVKDLAAAIAKKPKRGTPEHRHVEEWLNSVKIRAMYRWNPDLWDDSSIQQTFDRYSTKPQGPTRDKPISAEEFYRASGHESSKDLSEFGYNPEGRGVERAAQKPVAAVRRFGQGLVAQQTFVREQQKRRAQGLRTGDIYIGFDEKGKPTTPDKARFGITANKHWEYLTRRTAPGQYYDNTFDVPDAEGHIIRPNAEYGGGKTEASMTTSYNPNLRYEPGSTKRHKIAYGDKKTKIPDSVSNVQLKRTFENTLNVSLGGKKILPELDNPATQSVEKEEIVPITGIKNIQERYITRSRLVEDSEGKRKTEHYKVRVRYADPRSHMMNARGEVDQIAIKLPEFSFKAPDSVQSKLQNSQHAKMRGLGTRKVHMGERLAFINVETADADTISNMSKYVLGPARAKEERLHRERTEQAVRMAEMGGLGTGRLPQSGSYEYTSKPKHVNIVDSEGNVSLHRDPGGQTKAFATNIDDPRQQARIYKIRANEERARGNENQASRYETLAKDLGAAGVAAAGFGFQRRARKVWVPEALNRSSRGLGTRIPRMGSWLQSHGLEYQLIDVKKGVIDPFEESVINTFRQWNHPLSSPAGRAIGIDVGSIQNIKGLHPQTKRALELREKRLKLDRMVTTHNFFEEVSAPGASRVKRVLAKRRDHLLRDQQYRSFMMDQSRAAHLEGLTHEIQAAFDERPMVRAALTIPLPGGSKGPVPFGLNILKEKSTFRDLRAHRRLHLESVRLQQAVNRAKQIAGADLPPGPVNPHHALVLYDPVFAAAQKEAMKKPGVSPWMYGLGGLALAGAGIYGYHRYKQRKEARAGEEPKKFLDRITPGPIRVKTPYIRHTGEWKVPRHALTNEIGVAGRGIPNQFAIGARQKTLWKGGPTDRGYEYEGVGGAGVRLGGSKVRGTKGKILLESNWTSRQRIRQKAPRPVIGGKQLPFEFEVGAKRDYTRKKKNPRALTAKDRENLVYAYGLLEHERRADPAYFRQQQEYKGVVDFFSHGISDKRFLDMMQDSEKTREIRRKRFDKRFGRQMRRIKEKHDVERTLGNAERSINYNAAFADGAQGAHIL